MRSWSAASILVSLACVASVSFGCKKASTPEADETESGAQSGSETAIEDLNGDGGSGGSGGSAGAGGKAGAGGAAAGVDGGAASAAASESGKAATDKAAGDAGSGHATADGGAGAQGDNTGSAAASGTGTTGGATKDPNPTQGGTPSGVVDFLNVTSSGGVTGDVLMANLQKAKQRYRACYGKALAVDSSAQGTLKLKLSIAVDGKVEKVSVLGGNLTPGPWVQCSVATTQGLKLPPATPSSDGSFDIKYSK